MFPNRSGFNFTPGVSRRGTAGFFGLSLLLMCTFALTSGLRVYAQAVGSGQIQGTVLDTNGAAIPDASVEPIQAESALRRVVNSGSDGGYNLPSLPVGHYQLTVTKTGFSTFNQSGILIQVRNNLRVDGI